MFRVDPEFLFDMPAPLDDGHGSAFYRLVELGNSLPVWMLHVLEAPDPSTPMPRWRRLLIHDLREALAIAGSPQWSARSLYALLPDYLSPNERLSGGLCLAIWECFEPEDDELCWRIETEHGVALESLYGTPLGKERQQRLLWSAQGRHDGRTHPSEHAQHLEGSRGH